MKRLINADSGSVLVNRDGEAPLCPNEGATMKAIPLDDVDLSCNPLPPAPAMERRSLVGPLRRHLIVCSMFGAAILQAWNHDLSYIVWVVLGVLYGLFFVFDDKA